MKLSKKLIALVICVMMIVPAMMMPASNAAHSGLSEPFEEVGDVNVSYVTEKNPVNIDGEFDEWEGLLTTYGDVNVSANETQSFSPHYLDGDFQIGFKYDADRVYVAAQVVDAQYNVSTAADEGCGGNGDAFGINFDPRQVYRYEIGSPSGNVNRYWIYTTENSDGSLNLCMYRGGDRADASHIFGKKAGPCYYLGDPNGVAGTVEIDGPSYRAFNGTITVDPETGAKSYTPFDEPVELMTAEGNLDPREYCSGAATRTVNEDGLTVVNFEFSIAWDVIISDFNKEIWYVGRDVIGDYEHLVKSSKDAEGNRIHVKANNPVTGELEDAYYLNASGAQKTQNLSLWRVDETADPSIFLLGKGETRVVDEETVPVKNAAEVVYYDDEKDYVTFFTGRTDRYNLSGSGADFNCGIYLNMDYVDHENDPDNPLNLHQGVWEVTKQPTLDEEGERVETCAICGKTLATESIDKLHKYTPDERLEENFFVHLGMSLGVAPFQFFDSLAPEEAKAELLDGGINLYTGPDTTGEPTESSMFAQSAIISKGTAPFGSSSVTFTPGENFKFTGSAANDKKEGVISFAWASGYNSVDEAADLVITDAAQSVFISTNDLYAGREETDTLGAFTQRYRQSPLWGYDEGSNYMGSTYLPAGLTRALVASHGAGLVINLYPGALADGESSTTAGRYEIDVVRRGGYKAEPVLGMADLENPIDLTKEVYIGIETDEEGSNYVVIKNADDTNVNVLLDSSAPIVLDDYTDLLMESVADSPRGEGVIALATMGPRVGNGNVEINTFCGKNAAEFGTEKYVEDLVSAIEALPDAGSDKDTIIAAKDAIRAARALVDSSAYGDWLPAEYEEKLEAIEKALREAENPFVDVKEGQYFYDAVLWAVENKITAGTSATTFSPDAPCTRGQVVSFLWRAAGEPEPTSTANPFNDVKEGQYYYKAVLWAVENKITAGTSATTFSPNAPCTRGQVVSFLHRAAGEPAPVSTTNPFTDVKTGQYFYTAVLWAVEQKITAGTSATTFSPDSTCTRGQIVSFLYRADQ